MNHAFLLALFQGLQRTLRVKPGMAELKALTAWMGKAEGPTSRDGLERAIGLFLVKDRDDWALFKAEFDRQYAAYAFSLGEHIRAELKLLQQPEPTKKPAELSKPAPAPESPNPKPGQPEPKPSQPEPESNQPSTDPVESAPVPNQDPPELDQSEPKPHQPDAAPDQPESDLSKQVQQTVDSEYYIEQTMVGIRSDLLKQNDAPLAFFDYPYLFSNEFLPLTPRQMENEWRFLQRKTSHGTYSRDIDLKATVFQYAKALAIDRPKWQRQKVNKTQLLLLIDRGGSMIAHHALGDQLLKAVLHTNWIRLVQACYFRNLPVGDFTKDEHRLLHLKLYLTAGMVRGATIGTILRRFNLRETKVLIYSDAGAARGRMNHERIEKTELWLQALRRQVNAVVWLNPMPPTRWYGSSADWIREDIPMYEANRQGLHHAIKYLQSA